MPDAPAQPTANAVGETETKLKRGITPLLLFFFIVGDTLGAGIYTLVGSIAQDVGGAIWLPLIIALVLALLTAGTYAELITKYPHAGGAARRVRPRRQREQLVGGIGHAVVRPAKVLELVHAARRVAAVHDEHAVQRDARIALETEVGARQRLLALHLRRELRRVKRPVVVALQPARLKLARQHHNDMGILLPDRLPECQESHGERRLCRDAHAVAPAMAQRVHKRRIHVVRAGVVRVQRVRQLHARVLIRPQIAVPVVHPALERRRDAQREARIVGHLALRRRLWVRRARRELCGVGPCVAVRVAAHHALQSLLLALFDPVKELREVLGPLFRGLR